MAANQSTNPTRRRHNPAPAFTLPLVDQRPEKARDLPHCCALKIQTTTKGNNQRTAQSTNWSAVGLHASPLSLLSDRALQGRDRGTECCCWWRGKRRKKLGRCRPHNFGTWTVACGRQNNFLKNYRKQTKNVNKCRIRRYFSVTICKNEALCFLPDSTVFCCLVCLLSGGYRHTHTHTHTQFPQKIDLLDSIFE